VHENDVASHDRAAFAAMPLVEINEAAAPATTAAPAKQRLCVNSERLNAMCSLPR
jgi:hypothetical protein